jgi:hypothetical protein
LIRTHAAWMSAFLLAACGGKNHSLGLGAVHVERSAGGAIPAETTAPGSGGSSAEPSVDGALGTGGTTGNPAATKVTGSGGRTSRGLGDTRPFPTIGADAGSSGGAASGTGTGGAPPRSTGGTTGTVDHVKIAPVIPAVSAACPPWANGTISFMGLDGIEVAVGTKPQGSTAPMLVYWHGTGSTAGEFNLMAAPVADGIKQAGGVVVSLQNTTGGDLYSGTSIFGVGDLTLVDQLVACAVRDRNVDPRRIYTMGCSAGGLFAAAMAALRSNYVAAVAPNSGGWTVPVAFENDYTPPLMTVHGSQGSDVVILDFTQTSATADTAFKARGGFVVDCNTGGGHCGGGLLAGDVWKFFVAHPYGIDPEPWTSGLPADFSSQCLLR